MRNFELGVAALIAAGTLLVGCGGGSGRAAEPTGMTDCTVRTALALTESENAWLNGQPAGMPDSDFVGQYGLADASVLAYIRLNPRWIAALDARLGAPYAATNRIMR